MERAKRKISYIILPNESYFSLDILRNLMVYSVQCRPIAAVFVPGQLTVILVYIRNMKINKIKFLCPSPAIMYEIKERPPKLQD